MKCLVHDEPLEDERGEYHGNCPRCARFEKGDAEQRLRVAEQLLRSIVSALDGLARDQGNLQHRVNLPHAVASNHLRVLDEHDGRSSLSPNTPNCKKCDGGTPSAASVPDQIAGLTREGVEIMAAGVLREVAKRALRDGVAHRRNVATATREAAQLNHLAARLEAFANAE